MPLLGLVLRFVLGHELADTVWNSPNPLGWQLNGFGISKQIIQAN
jgi:hypothetical protein